jgi:hypothetical protein
MNDSSTVAEYLALKAANDKLRESGKQWLWNALDRISGELSRELGILPLQVGRQDWEFTLATTRLVGERYGARYRSKTMIVEVGWPRLPDHGFISGGGLALGRVSLSQNTMLHAESQAELLLHRRGSSEEIAWHLLQNNQAGERIKDAHLRHFFRLLLND